MTLHIKISSLIRFILTAILLTTIILVFSSIMKSINNIKKELEFYKEQSIREGTILYVNDAVVWVYDTFKDIIIEVDIYDELIHTDIEVGDTAIYIVDYDYTDADLLNIIKREDI